MDALADRTTRWQDELYALLRCNNVTQFAYDQQSHTSLGVDLEKIAIGSGIKATRTLAAERDLADGARLLREGNGAAFVLLRVRPTDPPAFRRNMDPSACRNRFRAALLGNS